MEGTSIPLSARVFAVADALDAMTSSRPYRRAIPGSRRAASSSNSAASSSILTSSAFIGCEYRLRGVFEEPSPNATRARATVVPLVRLQRQGAPGHGRGVNDRGRRLAEDDEAVEDALEVVHRPEVELDEEAVLAGDAMAVDHLRDLPSELGIFWSWRVVGRTRTTAAIGNPISLGSTSAR